MMCAPLPPLTLLLLLLPRSSAAAAAAAAVPTFPATDPHSGRPLRCDSCAPGTYMRAKCTERSGTVCAPCPPGSFTEVWNYIGTCLRCGVCALNEEVRTRCSASSDCRCECRQGYFRRNGMCVLHSECPAGEGVRVPGTPLEDTVCQPCSNHTFSDTISANQTCMPHRNCQDAHLELLLAGSVWHDNICISCEDLMSREGTEIIRGILPAFFVHQKISDRRLRRILLRVGAHDARRPAHSDLRPEICTWARSATAEQIQQLPAIIKNVGSKNAGQRLQQKLQNINSHMLRLCN